MNESHTTEVAPGSFLPGRAIDIVLAAAAQLGLTPHCASYEPPTGVNLHLRGGVDEATARAVFAALGATGAVLGPPYGTLPQADLAGDVPALGVRLTVLVTHLPPQPEPADPTALIAQVDAARAAADATDGEPA